MLLGKHPIRGMFIPIGCPELDIQGAERSGCAPEAGFPLGGTGCTVATESFPSPQVSHVSQFKCFKQPPSLGATAAPPQNGAGLVLSATTAGPGTQVPLLPTRGPTGFQIPHATRRCKHCRPPNVYTFPHMPPSDLLAKQMKLKKRWQSGSSARRKESPFSDFIQEGQEPHQKKYKRPKGK